MSEPGCSANLSSSASGSQPAPGFLPTRDRVTRFAGLIRNRSVFVVALSPVLPVMSNASCGGRRKVIVTSVAVTGRHLPAPITNGTSDPRPETAADPLPAEGLGLAA